MEVVLFSESGTNPAKRKSVIVTKSLEGRISLEDYQAKDLQIKRLLIDKIATMTRRMHEAGVNHRDYYLCHFLLDEQFDEPFLNLIDLHRAQVRSAVPCRWLVKDLGGLLFSALEKDITKRDLLRFVKKYKGELMSLRTDKVFWSKVIVRARKLYVRNHDSIPKHVQRLLELS